MFLDTNVLVYSANSDSPFHSACRRRVDEAFSPTFLTWSICYEFLRVVTHPRTFESPWRTKDASRFLLRLLEARSVAVLAATGRHAAVLARTLSELPDLRGNVMHDVHTAVLMREHGVSRICTRDRDFRRFPFLTVIDPSSPV